MNKIYIVKIEDIFDDTLNESSLNSFFNKENAKKFFNEKVKSFKEDTEDWDNEEKYEYEEKENLFDWWMSGYALGYRFTIELIEQNMND